MFSLKCQLRMGKQNIFSINLFFLKSVDVYTVLKILERSNNNHLPENYNYFHSGELSSSV